MSGESVHPKVDPETGRVVTTERRFELGLESGEVLVVELYGQEDDPLLSAETIADLTHAALELGRVAIDSPEGRMIRGIWVGPRVVADRRSS